MDSRSIDPKIDGQIQTDEGIAVTNGFVLVHSPVDFGRKFAKNANAELGGVLLSRFLAAHNTPGDGIYEITDPFPFRKVASNFRDQLKQYQITNRFKQSYITVYGKNENGDQVSATFNTRHLENAFDSVGRKAVGWLYRNKDLFNGTTFLLVEPFDTPYNLGEEINAIVMQSRNTEAI